MATIGFITDQTPPPYSTTILPPSLPRIFNSPIRYAVKWLLLSLVVGFVMVLPLFFEPELKEKTFIKFLRINTTHISLVSTASNDCREYVLLGQQKRPTQQPDIKAYPIRMYQTLGTWYLAVKEINMYRGPDLPSGIVSVLPVGIFFA
jgi:hypothetical protein